MRSEIVYREGAWTPKPFPKHKGFYSICNFSGNFSFRSIFGLPAKQV